MRCGQGQPLCFCYVLCSSATAEDLLAPALPPLQTACALRHVGALCATSKAWRCLVLPDPQESCEDLYRVLLGLLQR